MLLDNRTLLFSLMLVSAMMALSLAAVSWGREHEGMKKWAGALLLEAVAWLLFSARDLIPDIFSIAMATLMIVAAQSLKLAAIHEYRRLDWPRPQCLLPIGIAVLILVFLPYDAQRTRLVLGSVLYGAQILLLMRALLGDAESRQGRAWWLVFGAAAAILLLFGVRAVAAYAGLEFSLPNSAAGPNPVQVAVFVGFISLSVLGSLGFILMTKERADRALQRLAMVDSLTGVFNRRAFMERADKEYAIARRNRLPLALLMLDIDHFKRINDEYGHPAGDAVLAEIARLLNSRLRKQDTLGRYGGEEFCILLPATDTAGARTLAESLRGAVESIVPPAVCGELKITASIGVTVCSAHCANCGGIQKVLDEADAALYQAKRAGRNRVHLQPITCAEGLEPSPA